MTIAFENHPTGQCAARPRRARPGARRNGMTGVHAGALKISVTQAPEQGKSNRALIEIIARELGLKTSQVSLLSGETWQSRQFLLAGINMDQVALKLTRLPGGGPHGVNAT